MKIFAAAVIILFLAGLGSSLRAADSEHDACMAESGGVTVAMLDCIGTAIDRVQAELDTMLGQHRPQLTPEQASAVKAAQHDWQVYRQSSCDTEAKLWGDGSFTAVVHSDCWLELTRERLEWLQIVLADGDQGV
ncbi:lysozyme inhibitor LprI family protein [Devosia submarina]|uniref:lysozyme inhibitor LprI family protein n=1 Tax=Devosia submarina TaxID=1173082 RepID=UPI0013006841|nr:lysozyme inhibitor LprI family protein [Devosia submarina]